VKLTLSNSDESGGIPDPMSDSASNRCVRNALLFAAGAALYWALATLVPYFFGLNLTRLSPFFVGAAGFFFGFRAGLVASLTAVVVHTIAFNRLGFEGPFAIFHYKPLAHVGIMLTGPLAGRLRTVARRLQLEVDRRIETEHELREAEQRMQQIVNTIEDAIWTCSADRTRMVYMSPAFEGVFGIPRALVEKNPRALLDVVHPEDRTLMEEMFDSIPDDTRQAECRVVRPDGSVGWIHSRVFCIRNDDGTVHRIAGISRDITDSKNAALALASSEAKYRDLAEKLPAVVYVASLDPSHPILYVSPQIEFVLGYPQDAWTGESGMFDEVYHPDDAAWVAGQWRDCIADNRRFVADYRMIAKNGNIRWFHDEADIVRDEGGAPIFLQGVLRDTTRERQEEADQRGSGAVVQDLAVGASTAALYFDKPAGAKSRDLEATVRESSQGSGTVLVAVDERSAQHSIKQILQKNNRRVLLAEDGVAALEAASADDTMELLITDVVMPRMNGRELALELRVKHPHLKVLYLSGHIGRASVSVAELGPNTSFLSKPFSSEALARKIRLLLESPPPEQRAPDHDPARSPLDSRSL
jgi:PAS domain S-box-containing protein